MACSRGLSGSAQALHALGVPVAQAKAIWAHGRMGRVAQTWEMLPRCPRCGCFVSAARSTCSNPRCAQRHQTVAETKPWPPTDVVILSRKRQVAVVRAHRYAGSPERHLSLNETARLREARAADVVAAHGLPVDGIGDPVAVAQFITGIEAGWLERLLPNTGPGALAEGQRRTWNEVCCRYGLLAGRREARSPKGTGIEALNRALVGSEGQTRNPAFSEAFDRVRQRIADGYAAAYPDEVLTPLQQMAFALGGVLTRSDIAGDCRAPVGAAGQLLGGDWAEIDRWRREILANPILAAAVEKVAVDEQRTGMEFGYEQVAERLRQGVDGMALGEPTQDAVRSLRILRPPAELVVFPESVDDLGQALMQIQQDRAEGRGDFFAPLQAVSIRLEACRRARAVAAALWPTDRSVPSDSAVSQALGHIAKLDSAIEARLEEGWRILAARRAADGEA